MATWQGLLKEFQQLLEQATMPQETYEATEAASIRFG